MTLTKEVQNQLFSTKTKQLICLPPRNTYPTFIAPAGSAATSLATGTNGVPWTEDEHARFLLGLEMFPSGPWKSIASIVGSRTARQTMSHAQKYRQKIARRQRGTRVAQPDMQTMQQQHTTALEDAEQELLQQRFAQQHIDATVPEPFQHPPAHLAQHSSSSNSSSPVATLMTESLSEMHLTSEQIDEILLSLFEDGDDNESLEITSEDLDALMSTH